MVRFRDAVRRKKVHQPTSPKFCLDHWRKAVVELAEDESDRSLARAGEWFFQQLASARDRHVFVTRKDIDQSAKLRAIVAAANIAALEIWEHLERKFEEVMDGRSTFMPEEVRNLKLTAANGACLPGNEMAESLASGTQLASGSCFADLVAMATA